MTQDLHNWKLQH